MEKIYKIIIVIMILVLILTSCQPSKEVASPKPSLIDNASPSASADVIKSESESPLVSETAKPIIVVDEAQLEHINLYVTISSEKNKMSEEHVLAFELYLKDAFDLSIDIIYVDITKKDWVDSFSKTNGDGIIYFSGLSAYQNLIVAEKLLLIDEYINENSFDDERFYKGVSLLRDQIEHLYGIPTSYSESFETRLYQQQVLTEFDLKVPETIEEFSSLGEVMRENNGFLTMFVDNPHSFFGDLSDIFMSFGCYVNGRDPLNIAYNPDIHQYELPILNANFENAMNFILPLIEDGVILPYQSGTQIGDKIIASYTSMPMNEDFPPYFEHDVGLYLLGENKHHVVMTRSNGSGFAILKGSYNIIGKLSFIFDTLFKNEELMMSFSYGQKGVNFEITDEAYVLNYYDEQGERLISPWINISYLNPSKPIIYSHHDNNIILESKYAHIDETINTVKENFSDDMFYYNEMYVTLDTLMMYRGEVSSAANDFYRELFNNKVSLETAIANYRSEVTRSGVIDFINQLNSK